MSITTIRQLSLHQIEQLRAYFYISEIQNIGVVFETGDVIIEFRLHYQEFATIETRTIPRIDPNPMPAAKISKD